MTATLYRYGTPPTLAVLRDLLEDDRQNQLTSMYSAQVLAGIGQTLGLKITPYAEFIGIVKPDTRTGQEIIDDLIGELEAREKTRKEG